MKKASFLSLSLAMSLLGCHSNVRDSSPTFLNEGIQLSAPTVASDGQHAIVVMKASGSVYPVEFSVSRATDTDPRMEVLGKVVDSGRGQIMGWIAAMNETVNSAAFKRFPKLEVQADPDQQFTVSGSSSHFTQGQMYFCGPLTTSFTPGAGKVYLVEYQFVTGGCEQHVYDVSRPESRTAVASASKPTRDFLN